MITALLCLMSIMLVWVLWHVGRAVERRWRVQDAQHLALLAAIQQLKEKQ